jgi:hypothetical protein
MKVRFARECGDGLLEVEARVGAALGEAGRNDDPGAGFFLVTLLEDAKDARVGHDDAHEVRRFGQLGDARVRAHAVDLLVVRIHRIDANAVFRLEDRVEQPAAVSAFCGSADDRDRARVEHPVDRLHAFRGPRSHEGPFLLCCGIGRRGLARPSDSRNYKTRVRIGTTTAPRHSITTRRRSARGSPAIARRCRLP